MTSLTVRDLRLHWPAAEKALEAEEEIVITGDGKAVAKLVKIPLPAARPPFDAKRHITKMRKILQGKKLASIDGRLAKHREERPRRNDLSGHELPH